jgi:hypothetical protein
MPPGLDTLGGNDWGNMLSVYPEIILDPFDPMVTATLKATRAKYQEGIMTYGNGRWLHHYLTMKNTETELVRGDQQMAIEEIYAMLVHTSATHAGFEFSILPWSTRDFGMNLSPHGWFSAKFRAVVRNMMVREQGRQLHFFSALSPSWIQEGGVVSVRRAPTNFGTVNADLRCTKEGAEITFNNTFVENPPSLVIHIPWFVHATSVRADGKPTLINNGAVTVTPGTKKVVIAWTKDDKTPQRTYENAVRDFKNEYRRRYEEFLRGER